MVPISSIESSYTPSEKKLLLRVARDSIFHGVETGGALAVTATEYPASLQAHRATFVTLELDKSLRGCIGALDATRPLVEAVARHAYAAAFCDPRFKPLTAAEFAGVALEISVLSPPQPMTISSEADLLQQLRPGIDGLILEENARRETFLPSVWESLPKPRNFLRHLKAKAGLSKSYWSDTIKVLRYTTELINLETAVDRCND